MAQEALKDTDYLPLAPPPAEGKPRPLAEIQADLGKPIHPRFLKERTQGGSRLHYIEWHTAIRILDRYAPGWQEQVTVVAAGDHVIVTVALGIPTSDCGVVWRAGDGQDEDTDKGYGEASNRAYSQALRRAAAKFRLCLYLYYDKQK